MAKRALALQVELGMTVVPGFDVFVRKAVLRGSDENEWTFVCENGARFPVNMTVTPFRDINGDITGYLFVLEDITKRKEVERMKSEFISVVSHELRTPLTSIRGSLGLVAGAMAKDLTEKTSQLLGIANKNSERLMQLINDILDIDKIAAGEMQFNIGCRLLAPLVQQAVDVNRAYAEKFNITVEVVPIAPDIALEVDDVRFIQVFSNLLSNAIKFSPEGGKVKVFVELESGLAYINVQDNGPGIPDSFRSRIFERFSQADSSATRAKGGSGLGLHIAKIMVEQMKGDIGFDTAPGKGTTFWIEFPACAPPEAGKKPISDATREHAI
jgi:signal transduction histidine kinase